MANQKDRHLETPGEANRDKHINFLAAENGDVDPASDDFDKENTGETTGVDNGFFTDDNNELQTKEEYEADKGNRPGKNETLTPLEPDTNTGTLGDKFTINPGNADLLTQVKDDDTRPDINEDDQAH